MSVVPERVPQLCVGHQALDPRFVECLGELLLRHLACKVEEGQ
jgi:hypothetical protein